MAIRVGSTRPAEVIRRGGLRAKPHLYVIDFDQASQLAHVPEPLTIDGRRQAIRRRRRARRLHQAGTAAVWGTGTLVMILLLLTGIAGLR